jgi:DNA modification methylase
MGQGMKLETWLIANLTADPQNARTHDKRNLDAIATSLTKFGQRKPIVITPEGIILAGNGTVQAAKQLKWKEVQVTITPKEWDYATARAYALADNRSAELAEWDTSVLASQLVELDAEGWDIGELGFDVPERTEPVVEDEGPLEFNEDEPPVTKLGDVYQLGRHRLMCGDSTNSASITKLTEGKNMDLVFTDPPYNVEFKGQLLSNTTVNGKQINNYKSVNTKHDAIKNDALGADEFETFITAVLENLWELNPKAWYFTFCDLTLDELLIPMRRTGFEWKSIIVWMKNQATLSGKDYKSRYEPIVYGCKPGAFYGKRYEQEDIWQFQRTLKNDLHPTMKPIPLIEYALKNSSNEGESIIDVFGGSGSTLIAAEQTNRTAYLMELDPKYCDVIVKRWEALTGKKSELVKA